MWKLAGHGEGRLPRVGGGGCTAFQSTAEAQSDQVSGEALPAVEGENFPDADGRGSAADPVVAVGPKPPSSLFSMPRVDKALLQAGSRPLS